MKEITLTSIRNRRRFINMLLASGEVLEELKELTLIELRDKCSALEFKVVTTATPSGGVSRTMEKMAA